MQFNKLLVQYANLTNQFKNIYSTQMWFKSVNGRIRIVKSLTLSVNISDMDTDTDWII